MTTAEHAFGTTPPLSVGIEEELLLVDEAGALQPASERVLAELDGGQQADRVSPELFAEQIELKTGVCADVEEARRQLRELRATVGSLGVGLLAVGLHPDEGLGEAPIVHRRRYEEVHAELRGLLWSPPCGLHVHVGMPDPETAIRVANAIRHYVPALQALSANSPFWDGTDSGLASARTAVVRAYPRFQMPRAFDDYAHFERIVAELTAAAGVEDYTYIWWDVRPHPRLGSIEVRALDTQTTVAGNVAIAALIQALAAHEVERPHSGDWISREALEESYFQASRYGLEAVLVAERCSRVPAREQLRHMVALALPHARELGGEEALEEVERVLAEGNGADAQRRVRESAGAAGLLEYLAQRTLAAR